MFIRFYIYRGDEFIERGKLIQQCFPSIVVELHVAVNNTKLFQFCYGNVAVVSLCVFVDQQNTSYYMYINTQDAQNSCD